MSDFELTGEQEQKRKSRLPLGWCPGRSGEVYALGQGMTQATIAFEAERFRNHHGARGTKMLSWEKAWQTWCLNWVSYGSKQFAGRGRQSRDDYLAAVASGRDAGPREGTAGRNRSMDLEASTDGRSTRWTVQ